MELWLICNKNGNTKSWWMLAMRIQHENLSKLCQLIRVGFDRQEFEWLPTSPTSIVIVVQLRRWHSASFSKEVSDGDLITASHHHYHLPIPLIQPSHCIKFAFFAKPSDCNLKQFVKGDFFLGVPAIVITM